MPGTLNLDSEQQRKYDKQRRKSDEKRQKRQEFVINSLVEIDREKFIQMNRKPVRV